MYAQKTLIGVPLGKIGELRELLNTKYLPVVCQRPGFLSAYLLEQIDDEEVAELVIFWDSQVAVENFQRTGLLQASLQALALDLPGARLHRQGYIVRVATGALPTVEAFA